MYDFFHRPEFKAFRECSRPLVALVAITACGSSRGAGGPRSVAAAERMALVTAGDVTNALENSSPVHVHAFYIDRVPVTVRDYTAFVFETRRAAPAATRDAVPDIPASLVARHAWANERAPDEYLAHPVALVSWDDAAAYCAWRHARLPSEHEWERALRGDDAREYPWGNGPDAARLNSAELGPGDTTPVLAYSRGVSPFGLADGAGNVATWTSSPASSPDHFIVRGGAWNEPVASARVTRRRQLPRDARSITLGFRCARDATP